MEHRHTGLKAFADLMQREYWIHAVPQRDVASVAEPPGGSKGEPVRLLHNSTRRRRKQERSWPFSSFWPTTRILCCRFFHCQQVAPARVMQGACLALRSRI